MESYTFILVVLPLVASLPTTLTISNPVNGLDMQTLPISARSKFTEY